jgi:hypothetical protein
MKIGRSVFATFDGVTYTGKVTSFDENGLTFVTADGTSFTAPKGVAHKTHNVYKLFAEDGPFKKAAKGPFIPGDLIVSKATGVVSQVTNIDIDGDVIVDHGESTLNVEDFYKLGNEPYVYSESEVEPTGDFDEDEGDYDDDEDEEDSE